MHTEDSLTRDMLITTASQQNCVDGQNGDMPTNITETDIKRATTSLVNQNGYMFLSGIEGEDRFGTAPVRQAYFALMHTEMIPDLEAIPSFKPSANYPDQRRVLDSEWGTVQNARFLVSSVAAKVANSSTLGRDVYKTCYVAKEGYGILTQDKYTAQFIYRPAIYSNPLATNVTVGWKTGMVPRLLNDAWVVCQNATIS